MGNDSSIKQTQNSNMSILKWFSNASWLLMWSCHIIKVFKLSKIVSSESQSWAWISASCITSQRQLYCNSLSDGMWDTGYLCHLLNAKGLQPAYNTKYIKTMAPSKLTKAIQPRSNIAGHQAIQNCLADMDV